MATQYDIVKAYADLYYENASVKKGYNCFRISIWVCKY